MANPNRNTTPPPEETAPPEPTTVHVQASLAIAGLFARNQRKTVERTPFIDALIDSGKLVVVEE